MTDSHHASATTDSGQFEDILAANAAFAETFELGGFDGVAHAWIALVTCMDSRIAPLSMLGLQPGDAKIFRNPTNSPTWSTRGRWCPTSSWPLVRTSPLSDHIRSSPSGPSSGASSTTLTRGS